MILTDMPFYIFFGYYAQDIIFQGYFPRFLGAQVAQELEDHVQFLLYSLEVGIRHFTIFSQRI
ncbi:MAG: hypothetical protein M0R74_09700 [Dehalococcoidia bacterium]|nr:hypothetical protein [Dehalococcoidia bacterium]